MSSRSNNSSGSSAHGDSSSSSDTEVLSSSGTEVFIDSSEEEIEPIPRDSLNDPREVLRSAKEHTFFFLVEDHTYLKVEHGRVALYQTAHFLDTHCRLEYHIASKETNLLCGYNASTAQRNALPTGQVLYSPLPDTLTLKLWRVDMYNRSGISVYGHNLQLSSAFWDFYAQCPTCWETFDLHVWKMQPVTTDYCSHYLCRGCFEQFWDMGFCPVCREPWPADVFPPVSERLFELEQSIVRLANASSAPPFVWLLTSHARFFGRTKFVTQLVSNGRSDSSQPDMVELLTNLILERIPPEFCNTMFRCMLANGCLGNIWSLKPGTKILAVSAFDQLGQHLRLLRTGMLAFYRPNTILAPTSPLRHGAHVLYRPPGVQSLEWAHSDIPALDTYAQGINVIAEWVDDRVHLSDTTMDFLPTSLCVTNLATENSLPAYCWRFWQGCLLPSELSLPARRSLGFDGMFHGNAFPTGLDLTIHSSSNIIGRQ